MKLNFSAPLNNLSFGFVAYNLLNEFYKKNIDVNFFPVGGNVDISAYNKSTPEFHEWLKKSIYNAYEKYDKTDKTLQLWHINGAENSKGTNQNLLTFHELSGVTPAEINILKNQSNVFVTSNYTKKVFEAAGINSVYCPLGFDNVHFHQTNKKYFNDDRIVISVFGKLERSRKRHAKVIQTLVKKFANNPKYNIHLSVYNTFLTPEQNNGLLMQILGGQKPYNFNILPYTKTLSEFNENLCVANIVCDLGTESWSIPVFTAVGLGKYGVLLNEGGIKDWAADSGSIMIESNAQIPVYDNMFFREGERFNQGNIFDFDETELVAGLETSINKYMANPINEKGLELQNRFTWEKCADILLNNLK